MSKSEQPQPIELSRGVTFVPRPLACEVTCSHCHGVFHVMRLHAGEVRCPGCGNRARAIGEALEWRTVVIE